MEIIRLDSLAPRGWAGPAVTVGNFDGVHRGHRVLVEAAVREASRAGGAAVVLTFDPHPSRTLSPHRVAPALMTVEQKAEAVAALGAGLLVVLPFTRELAREPPEQFARLVLRDCLGAQIVVVGASFRFGRGRAGDVGTLAELGRTLGFRVQGLAPVLHDGEPISSTRIREALSRGAVEAAREMLGRRFCVDGDVVKGAGRGRTLGVPTANVAPVNEMIPATGVYAAWCRVLDGEDEPSLREGRPSVPRRAVVNVGRRPTFGGGDTTVEAHVLDYEGDLYARRLRVEFQARLREERAFAGPEMLKAQIHEDVRRAREVLEKP